jgi:hypothetical protein
VGEYDIDSPSPKIHQVYAEIAMVIELCVKLTVGELISLENP